MRSLDETKTRVLHRGYPLCSVVNGYENNRYSFARNTTKIYAPSRAVTDVLLLGLKLAGKKSIVDQV